jgi:hypothetical protein
MANYRKGLKGHEVTDLTDAWHHARKMGRDLNVLVTLRPPGIDAIPQAARCKIWTRLLKKLAAFARARFPFTAVWAFEANPDGSGEHIHVLMHVPRKHRSRFDNIVDGWFDRPHEIDVTTAHQMTRFTWDRRRMNAISYIAKQMTSQAWFQRGLIRKGGGPILGKRWGCTRNIAWKAREAWWLGQGSVAGAAPRGAKRRAAA